MRGLNGLDFIWHAGRAWAIEINPRPSALLELLDLAYGLRVFDAHVRSFGGQLPDFDLEQALFRGTAAGKAIVYAPCDLSVDDTSDWTTRGIRDIPHPGDQIRRGQPVCTILTAGSSPLACLRQHQTRAAEIKTWFKPV